MAYPHVKLICESIEICTLVGDCALHELEIPVSLLAVIVLL